MRDRAAPAAAAALAASLALAACSHPRGSGGFLPSAREAPRQAYGSLARVAYTVGYGELVAEGELISADDETLLLRTPEGLLTVARPSVERIRIAFYADRAGWFAGWSVLNAASSNPALHGRYIAYTLPLCLLSSVLGLGIEDAGPRERFPPRRWSELWKYARFPQGFPAGLDRTAVE